ncbi:hypothetical protein [Phenylobacterium sp.]|uniref:hypothetical protein n=1 Tax=Phenylobacterium sp. TaxID=1871053 RepID=UPI00122187A8|nr:hypothetical protein [Phenylobacterium sp.]THD58646.1 MAG: hypothetical protein E8A49_19200 [Phenylobacterium sp.]
MGSINFAAGETRVRARISMLATTEGGRTSLIVGPTSYRPNHNFFGPENRDMAIGLIDLLPGETLNPDEIRVLDLTFITWPEGELYPGRGWLIQEGARLVGRGEVIELLSSSGHAPP